MTKQEYIEIGFSEEDSEYLEAYPRLYPIASTYGITRENVDYLFSKMEESTWLKTQTNHTQRQNHLHSMFARLNYYDNSYDLQKYKEMNQEKLRELFGLSNVKFAEELLKVI